MYDSVTPTDIPASARMVAGYVDGRYAWSAQAWRRWRGARFVRIAVLASTNDGNVLDVERGDATPAQSVGWVLMRRRAGGDPSVYCNASTWPAVRAAFHAAGVAEPHYWIASWGTGPTGIAGAVAHQYADPPASGGHYDLSVVADYWGGVDPLAPAPATAGRHATIAAWDHIRGLLGVTLPAWSAQLAAIKTEVDKIG